MDAEKILRLSREIVRRADEGDTDDALSVRGYTELKGITISFNKMLGRVRKMEDSRQEFVSNVSHELKTPMTSMKVLADSLIGNPDASLEMYKDFMTDIDTEIERENKIINDLVLEVSGHKGFENAQTTSGGVTFDELNDDLSLKKVPGLYICGEEVDADGLCGGYNLQWAFSSGHLAGKSAAEA